MHKIGAHLSVNGGFHNALHKTIEIGGNALQIFASSPRGWNYTIPTEIEMKQFIDLKFELGIDPVYFHASYLINLANDYETATNSRKSLIHNLTLAAQMGVKGVIVHTGSFKEVDPAIPSTFPHPSYDPYDNVIVNINTILEETPPETLFMIENAGNKKIGKDLNQIHTIMNRINNPRLRVCLDTCHLYSAGYDLSSEKKLDEFLTRFDSTIGLEKLEVWHLNDSRDPFDSSRDRHENIGEGTLGLEPFTLLLNHPYMKDLPFIIETPGFDDKGPDKQNIDILKTLIK